MNPTEQSARWLADCPRQASGNSDPAKVYLLEADALAAIARHIAPGDELQARVWPWLLACFGEEVSRDKEERGDRLLEEVFELLQSGGYDPARVLVLRDYVWSRDVGEPAQEVGGVMITLAAYCLAHDLDMHEAGETELARIWTKVEKIRAKQAAKPKGSALPQAWQNAPGDDLVEQATAALEGVTPGPWDWEESHPTNACANVTVKTEAGWTLDIATLYGNSDDVPAPTMPDEPWGNHPIRRANARFIAFARQWVPEAAARIAALTATVAEVTREKDRVADINRNLCNSHNTLLVDGSNWQRHAEAAERESATLRARLARMEGAINRWAEHDGEHGYDLVVRELIASTLPEALTDGGSNG